MINESKYELTTAGVVICCALLLIMIITIGAMTALAMHYWHKNTMMKYSAQEVKIEMDINEA